MNLAFDVEFRRRVVAHPPFSPQTMHGASQPGRRATPSPGERPRPEMEDDTRQYLAENRMIFAEVAGTHGAHSARRQRALDAVDHPRTVAASTTKPAAGRRTAGERRQLDRFLGRTLDLIAVALEKPAVAVGGASATVRCDRGNLDRFRRCCALRNLPDALPCRVAGSSHRDPNGEIRGGGDGTHKRAGRVRARRRARAPEQDRRGVPLVAEPRGTEENGPASGIRATTKRGDEARSIAANREPGDDLRRSSRPAATATTRKSRTVPAAVAAATTAASECREPRASGHLRLDRGDRGQPEPDRAGA